MICVWISLYLHETSLEAKIGSQMALVTSREVTVVADGQEGDMSLFMSISPIGKNNYNEYLILKTVIKRKCH